MVEDMLLRINEVVIRIGGENGKIGKSTWRRWVANGEAPRPEKRGRSTFWKLSDIQAFIRGDWRATHQDNRPMPASSGDVQ